MSLEQANITTYDKEHAKSYDASHADLVSQIARAILSKDPDAWDPESTTVLDFACGSGLLSQNLAPHARSIVGIDIAPEMVALYNDKVSNQGIPFEEMHAVVGNLITEKTALSGYKFDIAVNSLSLHHIDDIEGAIRGMQLHLKTGGRIYIADIAHGVGSFHGHKDATEALAKGVAHHHGVPANVVEKACKQCSLKNFEASSPFRVKQWVSEEKYKKHIPSSEQDRVEKTQAKTRINSKNETEYSLSMNLMLYSAQA